MAAQPRAATTPSPPARPDPAPAPYLVQAALVGLPLVLVGLGQGRVLRLGRGRTVRARPARAPGGRPPLRDTSQVRTERRGAPGLLALPPARPGPHPPPARGAAAAGPGWSPADSRPPPASPPPAARPRRPTSLPAGPARESGGTGRADPPPGPGRGPPPRPPPGPARRRGAASRPARPGPAIVAAAAPAPRPPAPPPPPLPGRSPARLPPPPGPGPASPRGETEARGRRARERSAGAARGAGAGPERGVEGPGAGPRRAGAAGKLRHGPRSREDGAVRGSPRHVGPAGLRAKPPRVPGGWRGRGRSLRIDSGATRTKQGGAGAWPGRSALTAAGPCSGSRSGSGSIPRAGPAPARLRPGEAALEGKVMSWLRPRTLLLLLRPQPIRARSRSAPGPARAGPPGTPARPRAHGSGQDRAATAGARTGLGSPGAPGSRAGCLGTGDAAGLAPGSGRQHWHRCSCPGHAAPAAWMPTLLCTETGCPAWACLHPWAAEAKPRLGPGLVTGLY